MPQPADSAFLQRADGAMTQIQSRLDEFDPDELEADLASGVLKIRFADGRSAVMNRQTAAQQIWLAEGATAWHFAFDEARGLWLDTKGRGELRAVLQDMLAARLGRTVAI